MPICAGEPFNINTLHDLVYFAVANKKHTNKVVYPSKRFRNDSESVLLKGNNPLIYGNSDTDYGRTCNRHLKINVKNDSIINREVIA